jgi:hypothetical protein
MDNLEALKQQEARAEALAAKAKSVAAQAEAKDAEDKAKQMPASDDEETGSDVEVVKSNIDGDGGELTVRVNGELVNIIFQDSGDIDFEYHDGRPMDSEDPNFEAVSNFAYSYDFDNHNDVERDSEEAGEEKHDPSKGWRGGCPCDRCKKTRYIADNVSDEKDWPEDMTQNESTQITNFIKAISQKNYAVANKYLQGVVESKLKRSISKANNK